VGGEGGGGAGGGDQVGPGRLLLVVDQVEELFAQCAEEGQRRAFIAALHAAAAGHRPDQGPAALVVLGVRADFEARCADYPQLADPVQDRYLVTAMTGRQLRMAITEPAKKAGSTGYDALTGLLLAAGRPGEAATSGAGVLPFLSHALDQAWRSRAGETLPLADYERAGGIDGAVAASAQRAYERLTPGQQAAARQVFTRLTATSADGADYADRATRAELTAGKSPAEAQDVAALLAASAAPPLLARRRRQPRVPPRRPRRRAAPPPAAPTPRARRTPPPPAPPAAGGGPRRPRAPPPPSGAGLLQAAPPPPPRTGPDPPRPPPLSQ